MLSGLLVLVLTPLGLRATGCLQDGEEADEGVLTLPPPEPTTAAGDPATPPEMVRLPGEVAASRQVLLAAPAGGLVERVHVAVGDPVAHGQLLAEVDLSLLEVGLDRALAAEQLASTEHARVLALGESATDQQRLALETEAALARADRRAAELARDRARIVAPFDGVVAARHVEPGEVAAPGGPLLLLVVTQPAVVIATASGAELEDLAVGMEATVVHPGGAVAATGTLTRIHPTVDAASRTVAVEIEVENADGGLRPGAVAAVELRPSDGAQGDH